MNAQYAYQIEEITGLQFEGVQSRVNLWPQDVAQLCLNVQLNRLLDRLKSRASRVFLIRWTGNKVPRGAQVGDHLIGWTQHGLVISTEQKQIGSYDRLVEFGGESGQEQVLLVYLQ